MFTALDNECDHSFAGDDLLENDEGDEEQPVDEDFAQEQETEGLCMATEQHNHVELDDDPMNARLDGSEADGPETGSEDRAPEDAALEEVDAANNNQVAPHDESDATEEGESRVDVE